MSNQELYEIARQRIDNRNRRWTLWAVNLAVLILTVALVVLLADTPYAELGVVVLLGWAAIFVFHTIVISMAHSRHDDIEQEVAKLREATFEKPKRLHLTEDGELSEDADWDHDEAEQRLRS